MNLLLTDRLTCPRCGPDFGLILLADRLEDRAVLEGSFGCPNCRDAYPVRGGFGDLRAPPRGELGAGRAGDPADVDARESERIRALLGVTGGPGTVALVGAPARHGGAFAEGNEHLQVAAIDGDLRAWPEAERVSRLVSGPGLPFFSGTLRGLCLDGDAEADWLAEAARTAAPGARVVVVGVADDVAERLSETGLEVLAAEAGTVVATRG